MVLIRRTGLFLPHRLRTRTQTNLTVSRNLAMCDYTEKDKVAILSLNNPPVNSLSHKLRCQLLERIKQAEQNEQVRFPAQI